MSFVNPRQTETSVDRLFVDRWSPRAFTGEEIPDDVLFAAFEAGRWAPSGYNAQPWRFVYTKRSSPQWADFLGLLAAFNQAWAQHAAALIVVLSKKTVAVGGQEQPLSSHSFDAGAAWAQFSLQANLKGWHTHGIGGFDRERTRALLGVPEDFAVEAVIAIGRRGDKSLLSEDLQKREEPTPRRPLAELIGEGRFPAA